METVCRIGVPRRDVQGEVHMLVGLYSSASGLRAIEQMHDVIAENLAHANVPGYRGNVLLHEPFEANYQSALDHPSPEGHGVLATGIATDFTMGPNSQTSRPLDVAISGEGFFEVQSPSGPLYTRNGVFQINSDRQFVNSEGMVVEGTGGPISIPPDASTEQIHISTDGTVSVRGTAIGQIKVVQFDDPTALKRAGTTLFSAPPGIAPRPNAENVTILQGVREMSNVSAVNEMVRMVWATRHYEAAQKALTTLDEAIGQRTNPQT